MELDDLKRAVEVAESASDRNVGSDYLLGLIGRGIFHLALQVGLLREDLAQARKK
jgi:hypothetical protein